MTCKSTSAGAVRQRSPTIETSCADRRQAQENRTDDVIPEAHGDAADDTTENVKGADVREYQVDAGEDDAADVSDKESEGLKRRGEQFLQVRKPLEIPMEDSETIHERELVSFCSWTCSRKFRVTRKRVLCLGVSGARRIQGKGELEQP